MKKFPVLLSASLIAFSALTSHAQDPAAPAVPVAEPVVLPVSTIDETNTLIVAINKARSEQNLPPLAVDATLSLRAASAFPNLVNTPGAIDVTALRKEFNALDVGILRGTVTHRGAKSGAEFPKYWAQDPQWNAVLTGNFTHMGAATAKRSDGKLVAFLYLIRK
jgi:uncharacterized protein YkwD